MNFSDIDKLLKSNKVPLAVCMPEELDSVMAACEASEMGFVKCIFVGKLSTMKKIIDENAPNFEPELIDAETPEEAAFKTVELIRTGKASALMKGNISTPILLKAVLNSETGIKDSSLLSHVLVYENHNKLRFLTDGGMVPSPTFSQKVEIIRNAVKLAGRFGCKPVKVAVLSNSEFVESELQSSIEAAALAKMSERGQFGDNVIVDGPLGLDDAVIEDSKEISEIKKSYDGSADVLVASDIDTGNIIGKSILYYGNTRAGGIIIGAKCPVILLSRADTKEIRLDSIKVALAAGTLDL